MHCNVDVLDAFVKYPYEIGETEEADTWMREFRIRAWTRLTEAVPKRSMPAAVDSAMQVKL